MRVILDTNVVISAVISGGDAAKILKLWREDKFHILVTESIYEEYHSVLVRDKFSLPLSLIKIILDEIKNRAIWIKERSNIKVIKEDPPDNRFLECAIDGHANYIVSGDPHLIELKKFEGISIVRISEFLEKCSKNKNMAGEAE